jgi:uncharacterized LabA/DUF88 family protein
MRTTQKMKRKAHPRLSPQKVVSPPTGVYAYIDSQNLNLGIQKNGWKLSWSRFYSYLTKELGVTKAYLFIGYIAENEQMYEQLHSIGYRVVLKPTVDMVLSPEQKVERDNALAKRAESTENKDDYQPVQKGNIDAELVLQAMIDFNEYSSAVLVSGDGDFYCLAEYLEKSEKLKAILVPNRLYSSLFKAFNKRVIRLDLRRRSLAYIIRKKS